MLKTLILLTLLSVADEYVEVTVQSGDTLSKIASKYLEDSQQWPELLRYNSLADPNKILPGMILKVPLKLASEKAKVEGVAPKPAGPSASAWIVQTVTGKVEVVAGKDRKALAKGGFVEPGARIETGAKSSADMMLPDQSRMRIGANTKMEITKSEVAADKSKFTTMVKSFGGFLRAKVTKLGKGSSFEVHSPTAVAGVRGTEFSMDYDEVAGVSKVAVEEGKVVVAAEGKEVVVSQGEGTIAKKGQPPVAPIVILTAPIMKTVTLDDGREALEWERPKGAARCGFVVASNAELTSVVKETQSMEALGADQKDLAPGDYFASAFCQDDNGLRGMPSEPIEFTIE